MCSGQFYDEGDDGGYYMDADSVSVTTWYSLAQPGTADSAFVFFHFLCVYFPKFGLFSCLCLCLCLCSCSCLCLCCVCVCVCVVFVFVFVFVFVMWLWLFVLVFVSCLCLCLCLCLWCVFVYVFGPALLCFALLFFVFVLVYW